VPGRDRIVPPESARPLARLIPGALLHQPAAGHIGMAAGARSEALLWRPLLTWLQSIDPNGQSTSYPSPWPWHGIFDRNDPVREPPQMVLEAWRPLL